MSEESKWEGKASAKVRGMKAEQVWPLFEDFCSFHKWLPTIDTCYHLQGLYAQPGLIRYCSTTIPSPTPSPSSHQTALVKWCHEQLLSIDPIQRSLTYKVNENNLGFESYVGQFKVNPSDGDDESGCQIEWSFAVDPVEGWNLEDLCGYIESSLQAMAERMEMALQVATN